MPESHILILLNCTCSRRHNLVQITTISAPQKQILKINVRKHKPPDYQVLMNSVIVFDGLSGRHCEENVT